MTLGVHAEPASVLIREVEPARHPRQVLHRQPEAEQREDVQRVDCRRLALQLQGDLLQDRDLDLLELFLTTGVVYPAVRRCRDLDRAVALDPLADELDDSHHLAQLGLFAPRSTLRDLEFDNPRRRFDCGQRGAHAPLTTMPTAESSRASSSERKRSSPSSNWT